jgi:hypothetical protein
VVEPAEDDDLVARIDARSQAIRALLLGELDPTADVSALLEISVNADVFPAEELRALLDALPEARAQQSKRRRAPRVEVELEPSTDVEQARTRLRDAYLELLSLDEEQRDAIVEAHRQRQREALRQAGERAELEQRLASLELQRSRWEALLAGELDVAVDPAPLLRVDLGDASGLAASTERLRRATSEDQGAEPDSPAPSEGESEPSEIDDLRGRVAKAERALDRLRLSYWGMKPDDRRAVLDRHAQRQAEAKAAEAALAAERARAEDEKQQAIDSQLGQAQAAADEAAEEMEKALEAARLARSESLRLAAEERARLLGVKQALALFEGELAQRRQQAKDQHDAALTWVRRANAVIEATNAGNDGPEDPDSMYAALRDELGEARGRLTQALRDISAGDSAVPEIGAPPIDLGDVEPGSELSELRAELERTRRDLVAAETDARWETAATYRNDIVILNRARLGLLSATSAELQSRVTGFGADGMGQVSRELQQVALELRYLSLSLPRHGRQILEDVKTSPISLTLALLQLAAVILVFRWWRRRAEGLLGDLTEAMDRRRPRTRLTRFLGSTAWYLRRIRRPLEWLALAYFVFKSTGVLELIPELELAWLIVLWLSLGLAIIQFVDALAARDQLRLRAPSPTANIRIRSLRVTGLTVVTVGLLLSLTAATVGRGAIYAWVLRAFWVLVLPILLMVVSWWKPHIFEVFAHEPPGRLSSWINARTQGWTSFVAATVGGVFVFFRGIFRWTMRRVATFDATRRVLAYLFRREVAKQAEATGQQLDLRPLPESQASPLLEKSKTLDPEVAKKQLDELRDMVAQPRSTLSAIVGERGAGKTTLLRRLEDALEIPVLRVRCPVDGFDALLTRMGRELGVTSTPQAITKALGERGATVVAIDDAQRLIRPAIGGMHGLDRLGELARASGDDVSWVVTIGNAAWQYVSRARGERLFFDQTLRLGPWTEEQIGRLIQTRTKKAGLDPSFEGLVVPRQYDDSDGEQEGRSEIGFYRILWDYADGNPRVAALFWSRSLFVSADETVVVRLFKEPPSAPLDALALPIKFVLRALVQLERATPKEIASATRMAASEVDDALRFARARDYLDTENDVYWVSWPWYRAITNMLHRQHLLAA